MRASAASAPRSVRRDRRAIVWGAPAGGVCRAIVCGAPAGGVCGRGTGGAALVIVGRWGTGGRGGVGGGVPGAGVIVRGIVVDFGRGAPAGEGTAGDGTIGRTAPIGAVVRGGAAPGREIVCDARGACAGGLVVSIAGGVSPGIRRSSAR